MKVLFWAHWNWIPLGALDEVRGSNKLGRSGGNKKSGRAGRTPAANRSANISKAGVKLSMAVLPRRLRSAYITAPRAATVSPKPCHHNIHSINIIAVSSSKWSYFENNIEFISDNPNISIFMKQSRQQARVVLGCFVWSYNSISYLLLLCATKLHTSYRFNMNDII